MKRWNPPSELLPREELSIKRLKRTRKLFAFLRLHRHALLDRAFQDELEAMYRQTGVIAEFRCRSVLPRFVRLFDRCHRPLW
ncbi:MAG TPA: hypothetical protein VF331_22465 [Polyangiales bacterium]